MLKMRDEPLSPNGGACLRYRGSVFNMYDEPISPSDGACLRHMVNRNRQMRGVFNMHDEPESPNEERFEDI